MSTYVKLPKGYVKPDTKSFDLSRILAGIGIHGLVTSKAGKVLFTIAYALFQWAIIILFLFAIIHNSII